MTIPAAIRFRQFPRTMGSLGIALLAIATAMPVSATARTASARRVDIETLINQSKLSQAEQEIQQKLAQNPNDAHVITLLAKLRGKQHKYIESERRFAQAIQLDPNRIEAYVGLGDLCQQEERVPEAGTLFSRVLQLDPANVRAKSALAFLYAEVNAYEESLRTVSEIPASSRTDKLLPIVVIDHLALHHSEQAQSVVGEILNRAPSSPELVPELANLFIKKGMISDAKALLEIAGKKLQPSSSFFVATAQVQLAERQLVEAKASVAKALSINPKSSEAWAVSAELDGASGDWKSAVTKLKRAEEFGPPKKSVLQNLVYAAMQIDDLQSAHDAALDLMETTPNSPESALTMIAVLIRASRFGEAKELVVKVLASDPKNKKALLADGVVEYHLSNIDKAAESLTASLGQGGADAEAHNVLGLIAKQRGDLKLATTELEMALKQDPEKRESLAALGQVYVQTGEFEKGRTVLEKAIAKDPEDAQSHYQLGLAYRKLGLAEQSREQMALFQKLSTRKGQSTEPATSQP